MTTKNSLMNMLTMCLIVLSNSLFSQQEGKNGYVIPAHDTLKVLVVYVEVKFDPGNEPPQFISNGWQVDGDGKTLPPLNADS